MGVEGTAKTLGQPVAMLVSTPVRVPTASTGNATPPSPIPGTTPSESKARALASGPTSGTWGIFKWGQKLVQWKAKYDQGLEKEAETAAAKGDYAKALEIGLPVKGASVAFDLKLVEWAKQNHDLILAAKIIDKDAHGAWITDARKRDVYVALHQDPVPWLEAAQYQQKHGDYLKALEHAEYALNLSQNVVRANGPSVTYTYGTNSSKELTKYLGDQTRQYRDKLRAATGGLKKRLESLQEEAAKDEQSLTGDLRDQAIKQNKAYSDLLSEIDSLQGLKSERIDLSGLAYRAKVMILGGVLHRNERLFSDGLELSQELRKSFALESNTAMQDEVLDRMSVPNSRFALEMNAAAVRGKVGPFEMSAAETLKIRPDIKLYAELKKTNDPLTLEWDRVIEHRKATATFRGEELYFTDGSIVSSVDDYDPSKDDRMITYREKTPRTLEELKELNGWLQERGEIVQKIAVAFNSYRSNTSKNSEAPAIEDLADTIKAQQKFAGYVGLLNEAAKGGSSQTELIKQAREFLMERAVQYNRYFSQKKVDLIKGHEDYRIKADHEGVGAMSRRLDHLRSQWHPIDADLAELKTTENIKTPEEAEKALALLREAAPRIMAANERRIRDSLNDAIEVLPDSKSLKTQLDGISTLGHANPGDFTRAEAYEHLYCDVRKKAIPVQIDQEIKALKEQRKKAGYRDFLSDVVHLRTLADHDDPYSQKIHQLEEAKKLVTSNVPQEREKGHALLSILDGASINGQIKGKTSSSWWVPDFLLHPKEFAIDAAVIAGAALFAGFGGKLLGTTFGRYIGGEIGGNALTFTVSHRLLGGLAHGNFVSELKRLVTEPAGTLKETLMMAGMMKFVGKVSHLATKGAIKLGIEGGGKLWTIGFGAEIAGFRGWQLTEGMLFNGNIRTFSDLKEIALQNPLNDAAFIGLLRIAGVIHSPVSGRLHGAMEDLALKLKGLDAKKVKLDRYADRLAELAANFAQTGRGDLPKLLTIQEEALLEKGAYLKEIPAGLRDEIYDATVSLNEQALANVRQFRDAYDRSILKGLDVKGKNPFGLRPVLSGIYSYTGIKGVDMLKALKADPSVTDITVHNNGLVVVEMTDPVGRPMTLKLFDRGFTANVNALQKYSRPRQPFILKAIPAGAGA